MLYDLRDLRRKYRMDITGILHVGAHIGEEAEMYDEMRIPHVWWVEANPDVMAKLRRNVARYPNQDVIQALVTDQDGVLTNFNVTNFEGMSSSVFPFGDHPKHSPETVFTHQCEITSATIDSIVESYGIRANFLNCDIQGAEKIAFLGAERFLKSVEYVYCEVSTGPVYRGGAQMHELDVILKEFKRVETDLGMHAGTHGDALYIRY